MGQVRFQLLTHPHTSSYPHSQMRRLRHGDLGHLSELTVDDTSSTESLVYLKKALRSDWNIKLGVQTLGQGIIAFPKKGSQSEDRRG